MDQLPVEVCRMVWRINVRLEDFVELFEMKEFSIDQEYQ
jgi:hypothetical protein